MRWWITCPRRWTCPRSRASTRAPARRSSREPSSDEPFSALAFKIAADPFVGQAGLHPRLLRRAEVGQLRATTRLKEQRERVGRLVKLHANHREDIESVCGGRHRGGRRPARARSPATRSATRTSPIVLESIKFPEPVIDIAIEPKTKADQDKMGLALARLSEEDPTFRVRSDQETGQTLISGMGELHLEVIVDRMLREFRVDANVGRPQVAYRETITRTARAEGRFVRQSGGRGMFGVCVLELEPLEPGHGLRVREQDGGWLGAARVRPADRGGRPRSDAERRRRELPDGRYQGEAGRRLVPRGRLERNGVQDGWLDRRSARLPAGVRRRYLEPVMKVEVDDARRLPGRGRRRPESAARADPGDGAARQHADRPGHGAAGGDVRLRHRPSLGDPGPRVLLDGVLALSARSEGGARRAFWPRLGRRPVWDGPPSGRPRRATQGGISSWRSRGLSGTSRT